MSKIFKAEKGEEGGGEGTCMKERKGEKGPYGMASYRKPNMSSANLGGRGKGGKRVTSTPL